MKAKYPDAYPGEREEEYWIRKEEEERQGDRGPEIIPIFLNLFFLLVKIGVVLGLFIFVSHTISQKIFGEEADKLKIWAFTTFFTYLILCLVFFLKGISIGLRNNGSKLWLVPWVICVLLCCILPAYIIKELVTSMFSPAERESMWSVGLRWGAFAISLGYIYGIYQFSTPNAPRILYWSFALGLKLCGSLSKK